MYIGHFAVAYLLISMFPEVPPLVPLIGVGFPDILWPFFVFLGLEKVEINKDSPLQEYIRFVSYPYSHSLLISFLISCIAGFILGIFMSPLAGAIFIVASVSHWFLDTVVHLQDLPVTGFKGGRKVGFGLWKYPLVAFMSEFVFYALVTILVMPPAYIPGLLALGALGHLFNINSFFGFTKDNPTKSDKAYAIFALIGFIGFSLVANYILTG
ncbi:hypothetical protein ACSAZL_17045 [Methanosarcina sp. T3]|uniref:hypothetical protein n=1 Tax=Methanosarcina sp. T3 TaxID=3439062 RepID=UPI003F8764E7